MTRLAQGRTSIVIAHWLSTVVDADWILVMEHGRVVQQVVHRELLAREGIYAKLWSLRWQQGKLEDAQRVTLYAELRDGDAVDFVHAHPVPRPAAR